MPVFSIGYLKIIDQLPIKIGTGTTLKHIKISKVRNPNPHTSKTHQMWYENRYLFSLYEFQILILISNFNIYVLIE